MDTKQLKELFLKRQSCRAYSDKPVAKETIEEVCALAQAAPSACNMQPWKVYALTGETLKRTKALLKERGKSAFAQDVPVLLAIAEDPREAAAFRPELNLPYYAAGDVGEFTAFLVLAAEAAGLDSCIIGWQNGAGIHEILGLPEGVSVPGLWRSAMPKKGMRRGRKTART